jgi:CRISPR-associated endoribonuclease Cas6
VRLILQLKAAKDQTYENSYNHNIQAFVYDLIKDTQYGYLHDANKLTKNQSNDDNDGRRMTTFCFSNVFPYGAMKYGRTKSLIISSPDEHFVSVLRQKIMNLNSTIHLGSSVFDILGCKIFDLNISGSHIVFTTATPIIIRIPQYVYQSYNLELRYPYRYIYWRYHYPIELFIQQIWMNLEKKYIRFYGTRPNTNVLSFSKFIFKKQVSQKIVIHGKIQTVIGTLWDFWLNEEDEEEKDNYNNEYIFQDKMIITKTEDDNNKSHSSTERQRLIHFALEAGLGERNTLGFGFVNLARPTK